MVVLCPFWSGAPYEMLVVPVTHGAHLARATPARHRGGRAGRCAPRSTGCAAVVGDVAYNVVFHTAPHHQRDEASTGTSTWCRGSPSAAGFEQGTGVMINIVAPEVAAQQLSATD